MQHIYQKINELIGDNGLIPDYEDFLNHNFELEAFVESKTTIFDLVSYIKDFEKLSMEDHFSILILIIGKS